MTPERLDELDALCAAAYPGPWHVHRIDQQGGGINHQVTLADDGAPLDDTAYANTLDLEGRNVMQSATFIAEARTALPELLAEVRRLREAIQKMVDVASDREAFVMQGPRAFAIAERIGREALE